MINLKKAVGFQLCEARRKMDYSQDDVAEALNISQNYLSQVENGKKTPSPNLLKRLSQHYHVSVAELLLRAEGREVWPSLVRSYDPPIDMMMDYLCSPNYK